MVYCRIASTYQVRVGNFLRNYGNNRKHAIFFLLFCFFAPSINHCRVACTLLQYSLVVFCTVFILCRVLIKYNYHPTAVLLFRWLSRLVACERRAQTIRGNDIIIIIAAVISVRGVIIFSSCPRDCRQFPGGTIIQLYAFGILLFRTIFKHEYYRNDQRIKSNLLPNKLSSCQCRRAVCLATGVHDRMASLAGIHRRQLPIFRYAKKL